MKLDGRCPGHHHATGNQGSRLASPSTSLGSEEEAPQAGRPPRLCRHHGTTESHANIGAVARSARPGPDQARSPSATTSVLDHVQQLATMCHPSRERASFTPPRNRCRQVPPPSYMRPVPPRLEGEWKGPASADAMRDLPGDDLRRWGEEEFREKAPCAGG
jgi:hypothetical protein